MCAWKAGAHAATARAAARVRGRASAGGAPPPPARRRLHRPRQVAQGRSDPVNQLPLTLASAFGWGSFGNAKSAIAARVAGTCYMCMCVDSQFFSASYSTHSPGRAARGPGQDVAVACDAGGPRRVGDSQGVYE